MIVMFALLASIICGLCALAYSPVDVAEDTHAVSSVASVERKDAVSYNPNTGRFTYSSGYTGFVEGWPDWDYDVSVTYYDVASSVVRDLSFDGSHLGKRFLWIDSFSFVFSSDPSVGAGRLGKSITVDASSIRLADCWVDDHSSNVLPDYLPLYLWQDVHWNSGQTALYSSFYVSHLPLTWNGSTSVNGYATSYGFCVKDVPSSGLTGYGFDFDFVYEFVNQWISSAGLWVGADMYADGYDAFPVEHLEDLAYADGYDAGYDVGHRAGYDEGYYDAIAEDDPVGHTIMGLFGAVVSVPINIFGGLGNLTVLNIPIISVLVTFMFIALICWLIRKFI